MKQYTIGEVAALFQIPKSTLRYWDAEGLIRLERDKNNGYRRYTIRELLNILDIAFYRNLNMPVSMLKDMYEWNVDTWDHILAREIRTVEEKMVTLRKVKRELQASQSKIRQIMQLQQEPFSKSTPDIEKVISFDMEDKEKLVLSLRDGYNFAIYLPPALHHTAFDPVYGLCVPAASQLTEVIWERGERPGTYMQCLLKVSREDPAQSNLREITETLTARGYKSGAAVGRFLATAKEPDCCDFYIIWMELL